MFRIHDYELSEAELALMETTAQVNAADLYVSFPGQQRKSERAGFNMCELLLEWSTPEEFGVQRIRLGVEGRLTRAKWKRKLFSRTPKRQSLHALSIESRKLSIRACFPRERVRCRFLGWRLLNVKYWKPGNAVKIAEAKEAGITRVMVRCSEQSTSLPGAKRQ